MRAAGWLTPGAGPAYPGLRSDDVFALLGDVLERPGELGLADGETLHPMQQAFHENHGLQCGFCTPGMIMSALDLVQQNPEPSESEIRQWLEGNLCRCTGYHNIVRAVQAGAQSMQAG